MLLTDLLTQQRSLTVVESVSQKRRDDLHAFDSVVWSAMGQCHGKSS